MNLHDEITNLQCRVPSDANINQSLAWKSGHKQARHDTALIGCTGNCDQGRRCACDPREGRSRLDAGIDGFFLGFFLVGSLVGGGLIVCIYNGWIL